MFLKYGDNFLKIFFNKDKTAIKLEDPGNCSYDLRGTQKIKGTKSGYEMNKKSVDFYATAEGKNLPAFIKTNTFKSSV